MGESGNGMTPPALEMTAGNLPPEAWVAMTKGGPLFASPPWLRAIEGREAGKPHYFFLRDGGKASIGIAAMLADTPEFDEPLNLYEILTGTPVWTPLTEESQQLRDKIRRSAPPPEEWLPNMVVSLPSGQCITVGPDSGSKEAIDDLVEGVINWTRQHGMAAVSFLYLNPEETALAESLARQGLFRLPITVNCELNLPGESLEDYFQMLPGNRRTSIRREIRQVREEGLTIRRRGLEECLEELVRLRLELKRKYGRSQNEAKARHAFTGLIENFPPEQLFLFTAESEAKMVSFSLFLQGDQAWYALMTGTEQDDPRWKFVYFDLLFYTPVGHAYEAGVRRIDFGAASWQAKRNRGCDLIPIYGFILPLRPELEKTVVESVRVTQLLHSGN